MKPRFYCVLALMCAVIVSLPVYGQQHTAVSGKVSDSETGESLIGANVLIEGLNLGAASGENGEFTILNVENGTYTLSASFVGYDVMKMRIVLTGGTYTAHFELRPVIPEFQEVLVTATRAKIRETPVAFSNLTRQDIEDRYRAQDVPFFLTELPGINAYSLNGNGIGYSYLSIRGFDQSRIGVLINGIPHNDPETHSVYWIDLPDLMESVEDVQVQRGIGSSLYGGYGIGGMINLETNYLATQREFKVKSSLGSFNTRKFTASFNSGLIDNTWAMNARFSRILSDGYRDRSWVDLWSYYIGIAHYGTDMTTRFNMYGGPERTHFAFYGSSKETLQQNRKFNSSTFPDDTDNFNQPHYELINKWDINERTRLTNTLFYIKGDGYFLFRAPRPFDPSWEDVVQKDLLDIKQYGYLPQLEVEHERGTFLIGGEARYNWTRHWKEITASFVNPIVLEDGGYPKPYDYLGKKWMFTLYAHELYDITPDLTAMVGLQYMFHRYIVDNDKVRNVKFDANYAFLTPRLGLNYNVTETVNLFGNVSMARREPSMRDLWDPSGVFNFSTPTPVAFNTIDVANGIWKDPTVKPEELTNLELGIGYQTPSLKISGNGYIMDFQNEILDSGYLGITGMSIRKNLAKTMHRGLEFSLRYTKDRFLDFSSNMSFCENYFREGTLYDSGQQPVNITDNTIANFPGFMANNRLTLRHMGLTGSISLRHVGKQYIDNTQNSERTVDAYTLSSLSLGYSIFNIQNVTRLDLKLDIYNTFDSQYESYGHIDFFGNPAWVPGAERNFLFTIQTLF
ncbi:TonB-dependent receptor [candidate division KSB1 bacterium]